MILSFLKSIRSKVFIVFSILLLFFIVFISFSLPMDAYLLTVAIIIFVMIIYGTISFINFKQKKLLEVELQQAQDHIVNLKNDKIAYQNEVESYFLLWVHQMKTPITASKLILENPDDDNIQQLRQEILQIENYTNLTLSYLKLMNTTTDMTFSPCTMDEIIKPLIKKYTIQFIYNRTRLHYESINDTVITDARWATVMIEQLLNNALKYAKGKEIWITFDNENKRLYIKDSGIGINSADIPKIFDKGYSGFNGRLNDKSSGLGLFIAKSISEKLGHPIDVKSKVNAGSAFTIRFKQSKENQ